MPQDPFPIPQGVKRPWKPATEEEVQELEQKLGTRLPEDYRAFLKTVNGIKAYNPVLVVPVPNPRRKEFSLLVKLFTVSREADPIENLLEEQTDYRFNERVPKRFLNIGSNWGVGGYCISLSGPDSGQVYLWSPPDTTIDVELDSEDYLLLIASSFHEFWSKARIERENDFE